MDYTQLKNALTVLSSILVILQAQAAELNTIDIERKSDPLDGVILKLQECESNSNPKALNPNDHGSPSYGLFQWKQDSFYYYNSKYKVVPDLEYKEVLNVIYDPLIQTELTKKVLQEKNGWKNWYNCLKYKYGNKTM